MAARYWVGGSGTWNSSNTTNWSDTSGGTGGFSAPSYSDDVFFDSGSGAPTVTLSGSLYFNSFNVSDAVTFVDTSGSINISGNFNWTYATGRTWNSTVFFQGPYTGNTITAPASNTFNSIRFGGAGSWTLASSITVSGTITFGEATFNSAGYSVTAGAFSSPGIDPRTLAFGTSAWTVNGEWNCFSASNLTITYSAGASLTFGGTTSINFYAGGLSYPTIVNNISAVGSGSSINQLTFWGNNTFAAINCSSSASSSRSLRLTSGDTQTVTGAITLSGLSGYLAYLFASSIGQATLSKASGTVTATYASISNSAATGGATFTALTSAGNVDGGNNTGWAFSVPGASDGNFMAFF